MTPPDTVAGHTAGPFVENGDSNWHPDRYEGRSDTAWAVIRSDSADCDVAIVMTDGHYDDPEFDANVRLFLAAPDLLEALHCALIIVRDAPRTLGRDLAEAKIIAAIAKATAARQSNDMEGKGRGNG